VLVPTFVVNVVVDKIPVTLKSLLFGIDNDGVNDNPSNLINSLIFLKLLLVDVVTSNWPVKWLNDAVLIPNDWPVVGTPTIPIIEDPAPVIADTFAPRSGATPKPPVDPSETITPPLGSWFWFTSTSLIILVPFEDVIPVNTTLLSPPDSANS